MNWSRPFIVAGAVTLPLVGAGYAADATAMPPAYYAPRVAPSYAPRDVFLSGWYFRGDLGQRWGFITGTDAPIGFIDPTTDSAGKAAVYGLGAGFRHDWLRGDLTVDYGSKQNYHGTAVTSGDVTAKIQTTSALLNIYADLGTWRQATPYIGAGIGAARVTISDFESAVTPPFSGAPAQSQWNLAWAAVAGTAVTVSPNLQIDIGYRYLSFGNAETSDGPSGHTTFKNLGAHEVRVGLRWNLDALAGIQ
jgi:opacity protein-like surface antigen